MIILPDPEAGLAGDIGAAEEAVCVVGTGFAADLGVGTVAEERLSSTFSWVVECFLEETSLHCSRSILESCSSATFLHCLYCTVSLETEDSLSIYLLHLASWSSYCGCSCVCRGHCGACPAHYHRQRSGCVDLGASVGLVEWSLEAGHWSISLLSEPRLASLVEWSLVEWSLEAGPWSISLLSEPQLASHLPVSGGSAWVHLSLGKSCWHIDSLNILSGPLVIETFLPRDACTMWAGITLSWGRCTAAAPGGSSALCRCLLLLVLSVLLMLPVLLVLPVICLVLPVICLVLPLICLVLPGAAWW